MKALVFDENGLDNLEIRDVDSPIIGKRDVLLRVEMAGVNPVDRYTVSSLKGSEPMPHIPGVEYAGTILETGEDVASFDVGDKVAVYNKIYDASCKMCNIGLEN